MTFHSFVFPPFSFLFCLFGFYGSIGPSWSEKQGFYFPIGVFLLIEYEKGTLDFGA